MLRRDRQIRTQIHQLADACLVALSFWMAYLLRANPAITAWLNLDTIPPDAFNNINTILIAFALIPITPLILEAQGFYNRQMLGPRGAILWPLLKGCALTTIALVLAGFALRLNLPRWVPVWFGGISFTLIYCKEELLRLAFKSGFAQGQFKRRFILVGTETETARMCRNWRGERMKPSPSSPSSICPTRFRNCPDAPRPCRLWRDFPRASTPISSRWKTSSRPANSKASRSGSSPIFSPRRFRARASTNCSAARC